jgi:hypothetical protein
MAATCANGIHKVGFGAVRREAAQEELFRFEGAGGGKSFLDL